MMPLMRDNAFTEDQYRGFVALAKSKYEFIKYDEIDFSKKFVLWRHDVDFSLNRAESLARIEFEEGVASTFFINPHCIFYNCLEKSQTDLIRRIISMGHSIGLHFDSEYHSIETEGQLDDVVSFEAKWLSDIFGSPISAFSFHNPNSLLLSFEKATYGGLINCYSKDFKTRLGYCSDSNGRWRHRHLFDVLENAEERNLQILTHPAWWQKRENTAKRKIRRCAFGRAEAIMDEHEASLLKHGRSEDG